MKINYKNKKVNLPDFIIVGAQKSATTTIYKKLQNHSEVFMPKIKEINFFAYEKNDHNIKKYNSYDLGNNFKMITQFKDYYNLFNEFENGIKIMGECSVNYLLRYKQTIKRLKEYYGDDYKTIKIIISLRNPIDRAFSSWLMSVRDGHDKYEFEEIVDLMINDKNPYSLESMNYLEYGLYSDGVKAYKDNFHDVHILLYDDLVKNFSLEINKIFKFLNISNDNEIQNLKYNVSGIPKLKFLHKFIKSDLFFKKIIKDLLPNKIISLIKKILEINYLKPKISNKTKNILINYYKSDVMKLDNNINRDLNNWMR